MSTEQYRVKNQEQADRVERLSATKGLRHEQGVIRALLDDAYPDNPMLCVALAKALGELLRTEAQQAQLNGVWIDRTAIQEAGRQMGQSVIRILREANEKAGNVLDVTALTDEILSTIGATLSSAQQPKLLPPTRRR